MFIAHYLMSGDCQTFLPISQLIGLQDDIALQCKQYVGYCYLFSPIKFLPNLPSVCCMLQSLDGINIDMQHHL